MEYAEIAQSATDSRCSGNDSENENIKLLVLIIPIYFLLYCYTERPARGESKDIHRMRMSLAEKSDR